MSHTVPNQYRSEAARTLRDLPKVRTSVTSATDNFNHNRLRAYGEIDTDRWRNWARAVSYTHLTLPTSDLV